jgi:hypothetical protein
VPAWCDLVFHNSQQRFVPEQSVVARNTYPSDDPCAAMRPLSLRGASPPDLRRGVQKSAVNGDARRHRHESAPPHHHRPYCFARANWCSE